MDRILAGSPRFKTRSPGRRPSTMTRAEILTNIIDVAGISSSFKYDYQGWVTNLITPYGTTTFIYSTNNSGTTNEFDTPPPGTDDSFIIRSVKVIDPESGTNIYLLHQNSAFIGGESLVPSTYPDPVNYQNLPWTLDNQAADNFRDSFHWGPKQASGLPNDLNSFSASDYRKARMRHWLHAGLSTGHIISQSLSMEQEPSPDGSTSGQITWYDYPGKLSDHFYEGTNSLLSFVVRVMPDGKPWYTWFRRDESGHATNVVETYSTGYGQTPSPRTNVFLYD